MAVNIMELLRKIQRDLADQKEFMRNLHVTNTNKNEKIDKQQVTIEHIEHHLKKNNMALFGNDETLIKLEDTTAGSCKTDFEDNKEKDAHIVEKTEKYMENVEADQMQEEKETVFNYDDDNKKNALFEKADNDNKSIEEFITKEIRELKESMKDFITTPTNIITDQINYLNDELKNITGIYQSDMKEMKDLVKDFMATTKITTEEVVVNKSNEALEKISAIYQSDTKDMKESIQGFAVKIETFTEEVTSLINKVNDELKSISNVFKSDMKETKESINDLVATMKISTQETALVNTEQTVPNNLSAEEISKLCVELKQISDTYQSEIQAKKQLMDDIVASVGKINEVAASRSRKQVTVQITPTYLNTEQITKLNAELKRITEMYASTDVFPIIEVQSGPCDHPVMKHLSKGVYYKTTDDTNRHVIFKLGPVKSNNIQKSEVLEVVTEYPGLSLFEVLRAIGISRNKWDAWSKTYNFKIAYDGTADGYVPLNMYSMY